MTLGVFLLTALLLPLSLPTAAAAEDTKEVDIYNLPWLNGAPYTASYIGEGETLTWIWRDTGAHSIEGDGRAATMFTGLGGGSKTVARLNFSYSYTFQTSGTYDYHCHTHPYTMGGQVIVKKKFNFGGVTIKWFLGVSYGGASAIVQEGDIVTWLWSDDLPHGLTTMDNDQTFFRGPGANNNTVSGQDTFKYKKKFTKAGVYLYKCQNHGAQMRGNITVVPKGLKPVPAPPTKKNPPSAKPLPPKTKKLPPPPPKKITKLPPPPPKKITKVPPSPPKKITKMPPPPQKPPLGKKMPPPLSPPPSPAPAPPPRPKPAKAPPPKNPKRPPPSKKLPPSKTPTHPPPVSPLPLLPPKPAKAPPPKTTKRPPTPKAKPSPKRPPPPKKN